MTFTIDKTTYNKAQRIPYDPTKPNIPIGYQPRPIGRLAPKSIIVHTTNGGVGTTFHNEATYICNSRAISSHYLIGKQGQIVQFLDPTGYIAYHAGCVKSTTFSNVFAVGIEMHNTPKEGPCTLAQLQALDWLTRRLIEQYHIQAASIETHRAVAVFCKGDTNAGHLGRKIDPSGFPDNQFYTWRTSLYTPPMVELKVTAAVVNIRTSPQVNPTNIVGQLTYGNTFKSAAIKLDELGQVINGKSTWAHLTEGERDGVKLDGLGFVHMSNLVIIG